MSPSFSDSLASTKDHFQSVARRFVQDVVVSLPPFPSNSVLERFVVNKALEVAYAQGLDVEKVTKIAKQSVGVALLVFSRHDPELQQLIALYTTYFYLVDDFGGGFVEHLRNFGRNLLLAKPQEPLVLKEWINVLKELDTFYGRHSADTILSGTLEFITEAVFEVESAGHLQIHRSAKKFPNYLRIKTGVAAPYSSFLFPETKFLEDIYLKQYVQAVPDLLEFTSFVNDILSFYKESIASDERDNYCYIYAAAYDLSIEHALEQLVNKTVECVRNVRSILSSAPELLEYAESYIQGCIALHFYLPRYRLSELHLLDEKGTFASGT
ncbi:isoprenoid synthase domain-containing protein [Aspergillus multicolor]|uniref:isoprenoid synthase domain-containing protein n=1 Tax=Aspergillus multicolor TaxID=41759 RepID=UPI003CCD0CA2